MRNGRNKFQNLYSYDFTQECFSGRLIDEFLKRSFRIWLFCSAYPVAMADGVERATALQCDKIDSLDNVISRGCD